MLSKDLYQRFLQGQCSAAEEAEVLAYFREHPEAWKEQLQHDDFRQFRPDARLHPAHSANMLKAIRSRITQQEGVQRMRVRILSAAAALVAGVVGVTALWKFETHRHQPSTPLAAITTIVMDTLRNNSNHSQRYVLADGSSVVLYRYSQISFHKGFDADGRNIYLQGGGRFSVTKDQQRPFTVYASTLATTALGTVFTVQESGTQQVHIKLISGKIVVKSTGKDAFAPLYLEPGETLAWNEGMHLPEKRHETVLPPMPGSEEHLVTDGQTLAFNHVPLQKVLQVLGEQYDADIQYDAHQLKKVYVTATFSRQDSLINILQTIATLNNASVQGDDGHHYQLKK